jgi:hypothetical protein
MRPSNKSGGRQPAVLWKSRLRGRFGTQSRDTSRATKSGGRQPAVDVVTASATAFVHGRPAGRRCAAIVVLPLQARYTNHGWLTPATPDARRRCTEKATFAVHNRMFPRAAGINPPCFAIRTLCRENHALFADSATPEQERRVLARRGVRYGRCAARINALLADDATPKQKRRASTRRALRTTPPTAIPRRHQTLAGFQTPFAKNFCEQNCPLETAAVYQHGAFAPDPRWFFVGVWNLTRLIRTRGAMASCTFGT